MCMSVPQIDVASIRTRMSRRPGLGVGQGSKTAPGPGDGFTTACIFSFNEFPRNWSHCRFDRVVKRYWRTSNATLNASNSYLQFIHLAKSDVSSSHIDTSIAF